MMSDVEIKQNFKNKFLFIYLNLIAHFIIEA